MISVGYPRVDKRTAELVAEQNRHTYFLLAAAGACIGFAVTRLLDSDAYWTDLFWMMAVALWAVSFWFGVSRNRLSDVHGGLDIDYMFCGEQRAAAIISGDDDEVSLRESQEAFLEREREKVADQIQGASGWQLKAFIWGGLSFIAWALADRYSELVDGLI